MYAMQIIGQVLLIVLILLVWGWGSLAIFVAGPESAWLKYILLTTFVLSLPIIFYLDITSWQKMFAIMVIITLLMTWWVPLKATNDKEWAPEVARIPYGEIENDILVLHNLRNSFRVQNRYN